MAHDPYGWDDRVEAWEDVVVGEAFLKHYASASKEISRTGFSTYWAAHTRPYLVGVIRNFLPQNQSWTERLLSIQPQNPGKIKSVLPR